MLDAGCLMVDDPDTQCWQSAQARGGQTEAGYHREKRYGLPLRLVGLRERSPVRVEGILTPP